MSYSYVIDTFAWIEYLIGSRHGLAARKYIEGGKAATPTVTVADPAVPAGTGLASIPGLGTLIVS